MPHSPSSWPYSSPMWYRGLGPASLSPPNASAARLPRAPGMPPTSDIAASGRLEVMRSHRPPPDSVVFSSLNQDIVTSVCPVPVQGERQPQRS